MRRVFALGTLLGLSISAGYGCGDSESSSSGGGDGAGDAGGGAQTTTATGTGGSGGGGFQGCNGIACGDGACCEQGTQECVEGACLPACASAVRCGPDLATCCDTGQVCVSGACTTPGNPCTDFADCEEDEFCEPTLGACLPQSEPVACEYHPPVGPLTPELEWSWSSSTIQPTFVQVVNMPVVVDLEAGDPLLPGYGVPDVVVVTSDDYAATGVAYLRALDGGTGAEKWNDQSPVYQNANRVQPRVTPAAGDIDGDGFPRS